jgi:hypothetical protein
MEENKNRGTVFKLAITLLAILLMASFWLTLRGTSEPVSLSVIPEVPKQGEPILATFKLNNPSSEPVVTSYQLYANGELLKEGTATIAPTSSKTYQYAYANPLKMGEQLNFVVKTQSELGNYESIVSSPPYPPQVWSSFVSFASFSTSVMTSMSTMTYYQSTFGDNMGLNVGITTALVLIALLIFLELTQPWLREKAMAILGRRSAGVLAGAPKGTLPEEIPPSTPSSTLLTRMFALSRDWLVTWMVSPVLSSSRKPKSGLRMLRIRFSTITWILFIIFMGIVYTRVVMVLIT